MYFTDLLLSVSKTWDSTDIALTAAICSMMLCGASPLLLAPTPLTGSTGFRPGQQICLSSDVRVPCWVGNDVHSTLSDSDRCAQDDS